MTLILENESKSSSILLFSVFQSSFSQASSFSLVPQDQWNSLRWCIYPVALPGASVHYTDDVQATKCHRLTAGVSSTFGRFQSVTDEFWACVFLIPHEGVSRMTATVYPKDERGSGRVSVWYLVMTSLQNHMTFESLWQYFAEKKWPDH